MREPLLKLGSDDKDRIPRTIVEPIYHGTSESDLECILTEGIRPRGTEDANHPDLPSNPDCVYLATATAEAPRFAIDRAVKTRSKAVVLEIDFNRLDEELLLPNEDIVDSSINQGRERSEEQRTADILAIRDNLREYRQYTLQSLRRGSCAYEGVICPDAILWAVSFDVDLNGALSSFWRDVRFGEIAVASHLINRPHVLQCMFRGCVSTADLMMGVPPTSEFKAGLEAVEASLACVELTVLNPAELQRRRSLIHNRP